MVTVAPPFGRSATVAVSEEGGQFASSVVVLHDVSITGAEYPELYDVTADVNADMLVASHEGELLAIEFKGLTSSPTLRRPAKTPPSSRLLRTYDEVGYVAVEELRAKLQQLLRDHRAAEDAGSDVREHTLLDLAEESPFVAVSPPAVVELSGNLTRDVLALTGLTAAELAAALGRTERSVRLWVAQGQPPAATRSELQRLRTVALRLVGGLGPAGVRRWLMAGDPSALQRIAGGQTAGLLDETERLLNSPAT